MSPSEDVTGAHKRDMSLNLKKKRIETNETLFQILDVVMRKQKVHLSGCEFDSIPV